MANDRAVQFIEIWIAITILASNDHKIWLIEKNDYLTRYFLQVNSYFLMCSEWKKKKTGEVLREISQFMVLHCWFV